MSTDVSPNLGAKYHGAVGAGRLSVALIGPDSTRRRVLAKALAEDRWANVSEFLSYPTSADDLQSVIDQSFNVIAIELDSDPDIALDLVERLSASDGAPIMVFSEKNDPKLAVLFMRAGAREYLLMPLEKGAAAEALVRISNTVRPKAQVAAEHQGKLYVFVAAKGARALRRSHAI